jgi:hypothetical protein
MSQSSAFHSIVRSALTWTLISAIVATAVYVACAMVIKWSHRVPDGMVALTIVRTVKSNGEAALSVKFRQASQSESKNSEINVGGTITENVDGKEFYVNANLFNMILLDPKRYVMHFDKDQITFLDLREKELSDEANKLERMEKYRKNLEIVYSHHLGMPGGASGNSPALEKMDIGQIEKMKNLCFMDSIQKGEDTVVIACLALGMDPNGSLSNLTPLGWCMTLGWEQPEIAEILMNHKADPNLRNSHGQTPLHMACAMTSGDRFVSRMVKHGANVDEQDDNGMTPLMYTLNGRKNPTAAHFLIEHGAKPTLKRKDGKSFDDLLAESDIVTKNIFGFSDKPAVK